MNMKFLAALAGVIIISLAGVAPNSNTASAQGAGKMCNDADDVIVIINPFTGEEIEIQLDHDDCVRFYNGSSIDDLLRFCKFLIEFDIGDFRNLGQCIKELSP